MVKLLFVCLGNICRSPSAEAVMNKLIKENNLESQIQCDSAGTIDYHAGEKADPRMREAAKERGYDILSISRQIERDDLEKFDYIFGMDESNYNDIILLDRSGSFANKIHEFREFSSDPNLKGVPDPYYGGTKGFYKVIDILEDGCQNLLDKIKKNRKL